MHEAEHRGLPWACLHWFPLSRSLCCALAFSLSLSLSLSLSHSPFVFLSSTSSTDIYGIFFIAPAAFRSTRSRLVSSCLEEAPGTRNVSISVTIDGVPSRVSSTDFGSRDSTHMRKPILYTLVTEYRVSSTFAELIICQYHFQHLKNTPAATHVISHNARLLISLIVYFH